jgi:hypothetical protein
MSVHGSAGHEGAVRPVGEPRIGVVMRCPELAVHVYATEIMWVSRPA